jgi:hypothetical protein
VLNSMLPLPGHGLIVTKASQGEVHVLVVAPQIADESVFVTLWSRPDDGSLAVVRGPTDPVPRNKVAEVVSLLSDVDWRGASWRIETQEGER